MSASILYSFDKISEAAMISLKIVPEPNNWTLVYPLFFPSLNKYIPFKILSSQPLGFSGWE